MARALTAEGWACDINQTDYGEDLICQTAHDGEVDSHRILIQVKAKIHPISEEEFSVRINTNTIQKWLSTSDLVLLCVWSVTKG